MTGAHYKISRGKVNHTKAIMEHNIHFEDSSIVNVWDDIRSLLNVD